MIPVVICYEVWRDEPMQSCPTIMGHAFCEIRGFDRANISAALTELARVSVEEAQAKVAYPLKWAKPRLISVTKLDAV